MSILKKVRKGRGLTAEKVAAAVKLDQSYYSKVENGKASASPEVAARIALFFGHEVTEMQILYPERYAENELTPRA